jgi:hypothetical protein
MVAGALPGPGNTHDAQLLGSKRSHDGSDADGWYDTDDVYVTYVDNDYYLFNRRYPTVGIAISISM